MNRNYLGSRFRCDESRTLVELHQAAGDGDAPFGEDHYGAAGFHQVDDGFDGQRTSRIDDKMWDELEADFEVPAPGNGRMDEVGGLNREECAESDAVKEGNVIGHDQHAIVPFERPAHFDAEE